MAKKRYTVEVAFTGRYQTEVTASSSDKARELAETQLQQIVSGALALNRSMLSKTKSVTTKSR